MLDEIESIYEDEEKAWQKFLEIVNKNGLGDAMLWQDELMSTIFEKGFKAGWNMAMAEMLDE